MNSPTRDTTFRQVEIEDNIENSAHSACISEIRKFENTIISSSCYEKEGLQSFVILWNKG